MFGLLNIFITAFTWFVLVIVSFGVGFSRENNLYLIIFFLLLFFIPIYYIIVFKSSKQRYRKALEKLDNTLMEEEKILHKGIDRRPFALLSRRSVFAITNSRIIKLERRIFGGYKMRDYQWKDLQDAQISENALPNICGSTLKFLFFYFPSIEVFPDVKTANDIYKVAQLKEIEWNEKRRIRSMEELRAQAGGVSIGNTATPSQISSDKKNDESISSLDIANELIKIKELLDKGILSDVEFQEIKSKILSRSTQNF